MKIIIFTLIAFYITSCGNTDTPEESVIKQISSASSYLKCGEIVESGVSFTIDNFTAASSQNIFKDTVLVSPDLLLLKVTINDLTHEVMFSRPENYSTNPGYLGSDYEGQLQAGGSTYRFTANSDKSLGAGGLVFHFRFYKDDISVPLGERNSFNRIYCD